jgi:hypothetical protein
MIAPVNDYLANLPVLFDFQDDVHARLSPVKNVV